MMRGTALTRVNQNKISDLHLRLDVLEQRGSYFRNPVSVFIATNGPANLGVKVQFQVYLTKGIDSVEILRNTARDFTTASVLQTYLLSELTVNKPITYYDHDKTIVNQKAYYWIRVIPKPSKFQPLVQGPQIVTVPPTGDTSLMGGNMPLNTTNNATVDSINAGASATVRIYGPGGVGSAWIAYKGPFQTGMVAGTITSLAYATKYWVYWNGSSFQASTTPLPAIPDAFVFAGLVTTVSSGASATATATAVLAGTGVASVTMTNNGSGYTSAPTVSFTGGGGTGAAGTAVLGGTLGQQVVSVTITSAGTGYTSAPGVSFTGGGGGSNAAGTAVLVPTSVAQVTVNSGGSGYTSVPNVSITGGGGSGATATAQIGGGAVTAVTVGSAGSGFTSAPSVGFSGGQGGQTGGGQTGGGGSSGTGGGRLAL